MKRNREHGRIISVETLNRGSALDADAAAGATSITVTDAGDFDEDGGWLSIGGQVVEFTACDDDTGVIALVDPLTAAAEQGDPVAVYDTLYEEVVDYQLALVELDGEYDNPDPVTAEVAEGVGDLPEGDRGKAGESCVLKRVGEDEWEVVGVSGRPRSAASIRFEQDDAHTLTAADIAAGSATVPLSHRPIDEALTCVLASVPQRPTEWTIDYNAQTLTIPLSGWERAGDVAWVHYAYRKGITTNPATREPGSIDVHGTDAFYTSQSDAPPAVPLPVGTEVGDLVVMVTVNVSTTDARFTNYGPGTWNVYIGTASDLSDIPVTVKSTCSWAIASFAPMAVTGTNRVDYSSTSCPVVSGSAAILALNESSSYQMFSSSPTPPDGYHWIASSGTGFQKNAIYIWQDSAASSSPSGSIYYGFGREGGTAVAIGVS